MLWNIFQLLGYHKFDIYLNGKNRKISTYFFTVWTQSIQIASLLSSCSSSSCIIFTIHSVLYLWFFLSIIFQIGIVKNLFLFGFFMTKTFIRSETNKLELLFSMQLSVLLLFPSTPIIITQGGLWIGEVPFLLFLFRWGFVAVIVYWKIWWILLWKEVTE